MTTFNLNVRNVSEDLKYEFANKRKKELNLRSKIIGRGRGPKNHLKNNQQSELLSYGAIDDCTLLYIV